MSIKKKKFVKLIEYGRIKINHLLSSRGLSTGSAAFFNSSNKDISIRIKFVLNLTNSWMKYFLFHPRDGTS